MSYRNFSLQDLQEKFGIQFQTKRLFSEIQPIPLSSWLEETLKKSSFFHLTTEKARSEAVVFPILAEVKERNKLFIELFSGEVLNVDKSSGLMGECDFIFSKNTGIPRLVAPLVSVIEAKKADIDLGIDQCSAQLVGIQKFNEKNKREIKKIYGCVTNADEWLFLCLENKNLTIDSIKYYFKEIPVILGIFQVIIDGYK